jgi:RNA polymerase sigma-70 factor, ECF subfamily
LSCCPPTCRIRGAFHTNDTRFETIRTGNPDEFARLAEPYRRELQVHCYRMLGSLEDAQDLVQETLLRAWQKLDTYEGRASLRAWLYKIATNACLDALDRRPRRWLPQARQPASDPSAPPEPPLMEPIWLEPIPDDLSADIETGPEPRYEAQESITLAFLAALQVLPPRQRAVLLLRDVLDWRAAEVAALLDLTVSAVNSALHRARVTLARHYHRRGMESVPSKASDEATREMLARYVRAWETADMDALLALFKEEATLPMPPIPSWYQGRENIRAFLSWIVQLTYQPGAWRFVPLHANGQPSFAWYQRDESGVFRPYLIQVLTIEDYQIADLTTFGMGNPGLLQRFGLAEELKA